MPAVWDEFTVTELASVLAESRGAAEGLLDLAHYLAVKLLSFGIEDSVAHAPNLRRGIYVGKLQPAWRRFCRFLAVSG